jgi:hypothetical protein
MRKSEDQFQLFWFLPPVLWVVLAVVQSQMSHSSILDALLFYGIEIQIGFVGLTSFFLHFFRSEKLAKSIGWPSGNPFQTEVAFANLAYGVPGILSIWIHGLFWTATVISFSVFMFGAASVHVRDLIRNRNYALGNSYPILFINIVIPIALILLLVLKSPALFTI